MTHFEIGSNFQALTERHKHLKRLMQRFTRQRINEFLLILREKFNFRQSNRNNTCPVKVEDIVILRNVSKPRASWKLVTLVEEIVPGRGGMIGAAIV